MFPYYLALFKTLDMRRLSNLVLAETGFIMSRIMRKSFVLGKPWAASIEPTTSCNLRCSECFTGMNRISRNKGTLNLEGYKTMLEKLSPNLIYLTLYFQGEPLLNPHFSEMVKLARSQRIFVSASTNGHYLDENTVGQIVRSGLSHLIISMDGLDQETYEKYRVNGNLQTVVDGIKRLVDTKKEQNSKSPYLELQFLVMRHNEHQIPLMKEFAERCGINKLSFKSAQVYHFGKGETIIPTIKAKSRYRQLSDGSWVMAKKIRNRCPRIWSSLVITWDGNVVPCCYDKDAEYHTGNLLEDPLQEIWKNHAYTSFRNRVLGGRAEIEICRNCGE